MNYLSAFLLVMAIFRLRPSAGIEEAPPTSDPQPKVDCKKIYYDKYMITLEKPTCVKACESQPHSECPVDHIKTKCTCPHEMIIQWIPGGRRMKCVKPENCKMYGDTLSPK